MEESLLKINVIYDEALQDWTDSATLEGLGTEITNEITQLAKGAYQAKVPIRTRQLRDTQIQSWLGRARDDGINAEVFVPHELHTNSWQKDKPFADELASILDTEHFKRSHSSDSDFPAFSTIGAGEDTFGWQEEAFKDFIGALDGY